MIRCSSPYGHAFNANAWARNLFFRGMGRGPFHASPAQCFAIMDRVEQNMRYCRSDARWQARCDMRGQVLWSIIARNRAERLITGPF